MIQLGLNGYDSKLFEVKGATFYEMSKKLYPILILQFALRKRKEYSTKMKIGEAIKYMFGGVRKYKKQIGNIKKKKIYYMGDFCSDTGPAIVNRNYYPYMKEKCFICKNKNKLIRLIHFLFYIRKSKILLVS